MTLETHSITTLDRQIARKVRKAGSSFYWAMRLMDSDRRRAMYAVYAFCREVDDIADGQSPTTKKLEQLNQWREEIDRIYQGRPESDIGSVLLTSINAYKLGKDDFLSIIDGMEMDAPEQFQITDLDQLEIYCDRVACTVGRLSNAICGIDHSIGHPLAKSLGEALQLTHILRDIDEDAKRSHIYLPADLLIKNGYAGGSRMLEIRDPAVPLTCGKISEMANEKFQSAEVLLKEIGYRKARPPRIMMAIYRRYYEKLRDRGWYHLDRPVGLSSFEKAYLVLKSSLL